MGFYSEVSTENSTLLSIHELGSFAGVGDRAPDNTSYSLTLHSKSTGAPFSPQLKTTSADPTLRRTKDWPQKIQNSSLQSDLQQAIAQEHTVWAGYAHRASSHERFVVTAAQQSANNPGCSLFVNDRFIGSSGTTEEYATIFSESVKEILKNLGYSTIYLFGDTRIEISLENPSGKPLFLHLYRSFLPEDLHTLFLHVNGGVMTTGDNTLLEAIACRAPLFFYEFVGTHYCKENVVTDLVTAANTISPSMAWILQLFSERDLWAKEDWVCYLEHLRDPQLQENYKALCETLLQRDATPRFLPSLLTRSALASRLDVEQKKQLEDLERTTAERYTEDPEHRHEILVEFRQTLDQLLSS